jgi:SAM-dependent methyltransferase
MSQTRHFNFGKNWQQYSSHAFDLEAFEAAKNSLLALIERHDIKDKTFLDIGSGSGIFALAAHALGAKQVLGIDVSPESVQAAVTNAQRLGMQNVTFKQKNILSTSAAEVGTFDIVYSWGVLHHTGQMWPAIARASALVNPDGLFVIAIYNKHWSSPWWTGIKYTYNRAPRLIQQAMIWFFYGLIYMVKWITTGSNPLRRRRGMNFYYDVIDWIGGYPYEYASTPEIVDFMQRRRFRLRKTVPTPVPTGNNEFVFEKKA